MSVRNISASVRDRLLNKARTEKLDFNLLLTRYALERMLYRLSISKQRDQFLLKGALLFDLWFDVPHRPTHDADFLGFGSAEIPHIEEIFRDICRIEAEDGIAFQPDTVKAAEIRKEANYAGVRVTLLGMLDSARCAVQIDIGFGDAVVLLGYKPIAAHNTPDRLLRTITGVSDTVGGGLPLHRQNLKQALEF